MDYNKEYAFELKNINKYYSSNNDNEQDLHILNDINLSVKKGEMVAITGSSGSGKSTLLHIGAMLDNAESGTVQIAGKMFDAKIAAKQQDINLLRLENVGFVYQYHYLINSFNVIDNVAMPLYIKNIGKSDARAKAMDILKQLNLAELANKSVLKLSGGQKQRVSVARSLVNNPKIIFADEPTGNLDNQLTHQLFEIFTNLAKKQGSSIIMVTHNIDLSKMMDKSYILSKGKLIAV